MDWEKDTGRLIYPLETGNRQAFDLIFTRFYPGLCYFAERFTEDATNAEDIVEDNFLKLWNKPQRFESEVHLKAFLYRSVKNACLDFLKMDVRFNSRNTQYFIDHGDTEESYLHEIIRAEVVRELHDAIRMLPTQAGRIIAMSYLEGLSNQEIAEKLELSVQTVKNQKTRGLSILRKYLGPEKFHVAMLLLSASMEQLHLYK